MSPQEPISRVGKRDKSVKLNSKQIECHSYCPHCGGGPMDGATHVDYAEEGQHEAQTPTPKPGDMSICCYCGEFFVYDGDPLVIRRPAPGEIERLKQATDPQEWKLWQYVAENIRKRGK